MPKIIQQIVPALLFWGIFSYTVLIIPYPDSLSQANLTQISLFFLPLLLALIFTLNIFLKNIYFSFTLSFGLILLLILQALDSLNIVTGILIIISVGLFLSYFQKIKRKNPSTSSGLKNLTKLPKIHKLTGLRKLGK